MSLSDLYDPLDELDVLFERFADRLTFNNLALAKRYANSDLWLGLRLAGLRDGARVEYRAVLQGILPISGPPKNRRFPQKFPHAIIFLAGWDERGPVDIDGNMSGPYRYDCLVFVEDIKLVESPEGWVPTWVWLESSEKLERPLVGSSGPFREPFGFEFGGVGIKWEIGGLAAGTAFNSQFCREKIESRPQVMDYVPNDCAQFFGQAFPDTDFKEKLSGTTILLRDEDIGIAFTEGAANFLEFAEVRFGTVDF